MNAKSNTPTPGDLSARLLAYATRKAKARDALGVPAGDYVGQEEIDTLCQAAAALSALPAAGGDEVPEDWTRFTFHDQRIACHPSIADRVQRALLREATTPQPSAEPAAGGEETDCAHEWYPYVQVIYKKPPPVYMSESAIEAYENLGRHCATCGKIEPPTTPQPSAAEDATCRCDLRTKLVGDGCEVCNPDAAIGAQGDGIRPWPQFVKDEILEVLRNMDTQLRATGQASARIERAINMLAGMPAAPAAVADNAEAWLMVIQAAHDSPQWTATSGTNLERVLALLAPAATPTDGGEGS